MKVLLFVGFLVVVLVVLLMNVQEGMTSYTPQEIYDVLKLTPSEKINKIIYNHKSSIDSSVFKIGNLKETDSDYATKKETLTNDITNKGMALTKLQSISKEHQKKLASAYMQELKAANPNLIV
jgi:hypothetical protein